jgi:hypothetical protein
MSTIKNAVIAAFREMADAIDARWSTSENYGRFSKAGIIIQVLWLVDGISGIFVTLLPDDNVAGPKHGYGLAYLVEFRGGSELEVSQAKSDDLASIVGLAEKYAVPFLAGSVHDFSEFIAFAEGRVRENIAKLPPVPMIKTNKTVRAEWI